MKNVQDIMVQNVVAANPDTPVAAAAKQMIKESIGCLVVTKEGKTIGIITDRDLLACAALQHNMQECTISNHMSSPVVSVPPETLVINLAKVMTTRQIKRVPITQDGELVGIVSFSDIAEDMDCQLADMWSEWLDLIAVTKTSAQHRRGKRLDKKTQKEAKVLTASHHR